VALYRLAKIVDELEELVKPKSASETPAASTER
jgi:hypothetical protein